MSYLDFLNFGAEVFSRLQEEGFVMVSWRDEYKVILKAAVVPGETILTYDQIARSKDAMKTLLDVGWEEAFAEELDNRAR